MTARAAAEQALRLVLSMEKQNLDPNEMAEVLHIASAIVQTQHAAWVRKMQLKQQEVKDE